MSVCACVCVCVCLCVCVCVCSICCTILCEFGGCQQGADVETLFAAALEREGGRDCRAAAEVGTATWHA